MTDCSLTEPTNGLKIYLFALHPICEFSFIGESHGICAISGFLHSIYGDAVSISVYDQQLMSIKEFVNNVIHDKPDLIGISVKMLTYHQFEILYAAFENKVFPLYRPIVVIGNSTAHFGGLDFLHRYPDVIVSLGEGELAFGDLTEYMAGRISFDSIRNIMYFRNGTIRRGKYEYLNKNLIPVADRRNSRLFYDRGGEVYIEGSRGCAYCGCNICECRDFLGSRIRSFRWRDRPVDSIVAELGILQNAGIKSVTFSDEDFCGDDTYGLRRAMMLAREIQRQKISIEFRINVRVRTLYATDDTPDMQALKRETFIALKQAGLSKIFLGFESGSQTQLKRYNKGFFLSEFIEAKRILTEVDIDFELGYISLDPLMSLEELEDSLTFIEHNDCIPRISSIYKEMRIQNGNTSYRTLVERFEKTHNIQIIGDMLFHEQMYDVIRYVDCRVDLFRRMMRGYEHQTYKLYYFLRILTQYAFNDNNEDCLKTAVYETMKSLKGNDYALMMALIRTIKKVGTDECKLKSVVGFYRDMRKKIYQSLIERTFQSSIPKFVQLEYLYRETYGG